MTEIEIKAAIEEENEAEKREAEKHREDRKLPTRKVAQRYGVSVRSIERWEADEKLAFPTPIKIHMRKYWSLNDLEKWERKLPTLKASAA
jgi:predicted DNA-binding transcriptional regulator AlpA